MKKPSAFQRIYWKFLAKPAQERGIFSAALKCPPTKIVEIGMGTADRAERMLRLAAKLNPDTPIQFTGIDYFDARPNDQSPLSLKEIHCRLKRDGARIKLIPGDPFSALSRCANELAGTDLLILGRESECEAMNRAWFYIPRMIHEQTHVFRELADETYERIDAVEVERLSSASGHKRAA